MLAPGSLPSARKLNLLQMRGRQRAALPSRVGNETLSEILPPPRKLSLVRRLHSRPRGRDSAASNSASNRCQSFKISCE